jgi:hypothetical protein
MERQTLDELLAEITKEFPTFELIPKSGSTFMKVLDFLLKLITFWQMNSFMTTFTTTIGEKVYTSSSWEVLTEVSKIITLRHERVHMRQKKKYTSFGFSFLYLFFPLPIGLAYFRKKFEMEAYAETIRSLALYHTLSVVKRVKVRGWLIDHFLTSQYFWMWPFRSSVERWYDGVVEELESAETR